MRASHLKRSPDRIHYGVILQLVGKLQGALASRRLSEARAFATSLRTIVGVELIQVATSETIRAALDTLMGTIDKMTTNSPPVALVNGEASYVTTIRAFGDAAVQVYLSAASSYDDDSRRNLTDNIRGYRWYDDETGMLLADVMEWEITLDVTQDSITTRHLRLDVEDAYDAVGQAYAIVILDGSSR